MSTERTLKTNRDLLAERAEQIAANDFRVRLDRIVAVEKHVARLAKT